MKNPLKKRLPRDLKHNLGRYLAVVMMLSVAIAFISGFLAVTDGVRTAFDENRISCKVEDGQFKSYTMIDDNILLEVQKIDASIYPDFYVEDISNEDFTLRIYKDREFINLETVITGEFPDQVDEIALERLFANSNGIRIGDSITIKGKIMIVTAFVSVPDYSSLFQKNSNMMMDSFHFGVAFVTKEAFAEYAETDLKYNYSYYFTDRNLSDMDKRELSIEIKTSLLENGAVLTDFCTAERNQSITFIEDDMGSDVPMMNVFAYIIICIMAFVFAIIISSTIEAESAMIGTLLALGYSKGELIRHYMGMPFIVTVFSAVIGNLIGYTVSPGLFQDMYYNSYSLPPMQIEINTYALFLTTCLPIAIMLLINYLTLQRKLKITPLNFLRRELKKKSNRKAAKLPNLSFLNRFKLRVILQNKRSYLMLFIGIFFASFLLMFGLCMVPMINHYIDSITSSVKAEYQYVLKLPAEAENGEIAEKATFYSLKTQYRLADKDVEVAFYGLQEESAYFNDLPISKEENGIYISDGLLKKIGIKIGDVVTFTNPITSKAYELEIIGTYEYPAGLTVFISKEHLNGLLGYEEGYFNCYLSDQELKFQDENVIATVITPEDMTKLGDQMMSSFSSMAPMCIVVAIVIYLVLMYILTKIVIDKNAVNMSFMRVFGYEAKEIKKLYLNTTSLVVTGSLILCLPLVYLAIRASFILVMIKVSGYLPIYIPEYLYLEIVAAGLVSYFFINFFHVQRIKKVKLSSALKNRE